MWIYGKTLRKFKLSFSRILYWIDIFPLFRISVKWEIWKFYNWRPVTHLKSWKFYSTDTKKERNDNFNKTQNPNNLCNYFSENSYLDLILQIEDRLLTDVFKKWPFGSTHCLGQVQYIFWCQNTNNQLRKMSQSIL